MQTSANGVGRNRTFSIPASCVKRRAKKLVLVPIFLLCMFCVANLNRLQQGVIGVEENNNNFPAEVKDAVLHDPERNKPFYRQGYLTTRNNKYEGEMAGNKNAVAQLRGTGAGSKDEQMACNLPNLSPFDPSIKEFIEDPDPVVCEDENFPLIFELVDEDTLVRVNAPEDYNFNRCCYSEILRSAYSDDMVTASAVCTPITEHLTAIPSSVETFVVSCYNTSNSDENMVDVDVFSIPRIKLSAEERVKASRPFMHEDAINVVILGLDAISHMNFQRTMPRTHAFLVSNLSALYFNGYTKVGDNTFPNILPVLTGKSTEEIKQSCWESQDGTFDECPFIWKEYARQGYLTSYGEDCPEMSTFNYFKEGFKQSPADYYLRPMYIAQDRFIGHENQLNANLCYGPRTTFEVAFNYLKRFGSFMGQLRRYFQFLWVNAMFHDYLNSPGLGDEPLVDLLAWYQSQGLLENTAFVLMSDHGIRWGGIRETLQGKIEERMPFLYITLPPRFKERFPQALANMKLNQERLTTHFDLHETLLDLLYLNYISPSKLSEREESLSELRTLPRGISLFLPVPKRRTCSDAGINDHWCVCSKMAPVNITNNPEVHQGTAAILKYMNEKLSVEPNCAHLGLKTVVRAQMSWEGPESKPDESPNEENLQLENGNTEGAADAIENMRKNATDAPEGARGRLYEITFKTVPGLALFEASAFVDEEGSWKVTGGISRTNLYGKQSRCVKDSLLKIMCFCLN